MPLCGDPFRTSILTSAPGKLLFVTNYGIWILTTDSLGRTAPRGFFANGGAPASGLVKNKCLVAEQEAWCIGFFDVSDSNKPTLISTLELPRRIKYWTEVAWDNGATNSIFYYGDFLYVGTFKGIEIADIHDVRNPAWVGYVPENVLYEYNLDNHISLALNSGYMYVSHDSSLSTYCLCNPTNPQLLSEIKVQPYVHDFVVAGNYGYLPSTEGGITVIDLSTPTQPKALKTISHADWNGWPWRALNLLVKDTVLYNASSSGLLFYSISRPDTLLLIDSIPIPTTAWPYAALETDGSYVYMSDEHGLFAFDVLRAGQLVQIDGLPQYWLMSAQGGSVYTSMNGLYGEGLALLKNLQQQGVGSEPSNNFISTVYHSYPNPFNSTVTFSFAVPGNQSAPPCSHVSVKVYDILGRLAATLFEGDEPPGSHLVRWTPLGLSTGVYFSRIEIGTNATTQRIIFLK